MFFRLSPKLALFALFLIAVLPTFSQVVAPARRSGSPFSIGGGFNVWDTDWGHTKMEGGTIWADYYPTHIPYYLRGLGAEVELRDISLNKGDKPDNFRQVTVGGGPIYSWRHFRNFRPYIKWNLAYGGINTRFARLPNYTHDTRTVSAPGFGVQYRLIGPIWARADYEYQFWPKLFGPHTLNPRGYTFGAMYDFRWHSR